MANETRVIRISPAAYDYIAAVARERRITVGAVIAEWVDRYGERWKQQQELDAFDRRIDEAEAQP